MHRTPTDVARDVAKENPLGLATEQPTTTKRHAVKLQNMRTIGGVLHLYGAVLELAVVKQTTQPNGMHGHHDNKTPAKLDICTALHMRVRSSKPMSKSNSHEPDLDFLFICHRSLATVIRYRTDYPNPFGRNCQF
jgi:hypothetical protein